MLVKLTPVVNFINILQAAFEPIFFRQKVIKPNCNWTKASKALLNKKGDISIAYIDDVTSCFLEAFREEPGGPLLSPIVLTFFKSKK